MADAFTDKDMQCVDCGNPFVFTARDQEFFQRQGFQNPKRCRECRAIKKANSQPMSGNNFNSNRNFGNRQGNY